MQNLKSEELPVDCEGCDNEENDIDHHKNHDWKMQVQTKSFICQETLLQPNLRQCELRPCVHRHQVVHNDHHQGQNPAATPR